MKAISAFLQNDPATGLAIGGLVLGFLFGLLLQRTGFCAMGAVSDWQTFGDTRRLRAWLLAGAAAIAGAAMLDAAGVVDLAKTMYLAPRLNWSGHAIGGVMFGIGMVLAGGCVSRTLVRAGGGDLRALLVLLLVGLFSSIALSGVLGPTRVALEAATAIALDTPTQGLPDFIGLPISRVYVALISALLIAVWCLTSAKFRASPAHILSGLGVGLSVTAGWALTGLSFDEMSARPLNPASLTFVKPTSDTLDWLGRSTALGLPGFSPASVLGTFAGALAGALASGRFRLATFHDLGDTLRAICGAVLMGIGGVLALGCSIGQGVTGLSTLAVGSLLTLGAIITGAIIGLKSLERWG